MLEETNGQLSTLSWEHTWAVNQVKHSISKYSSTAMQKPPVLKADLHKCHAKGSTEALGSGIRSDSLFPTVCLRRFRFRESQKERQSSDHSVRKYLETNCEGIHAHVLHFSSTVKSLDGILSLVHKLIKITIVVFSSFWGPIKWKEALSNGQQSWKTLWGLTTEKQSRKYTHTDAAWCWFAHPMTTVIIPTVSFFKVTCWVILPPTAVISAWKF